MALIYHATLENLLPTVGDSELVAGNGAVVNEDHLSLPNPGSGVYLETPIALGSTYTISVWFKDLKARSSSQESYMMLNGSSLGGGSNGSHAGVQAAYDIVIWHNDELGSWHSTGGWQSSGYAMTQANFTGDWHHLVASFDNGTLTYYIDGAQVGNSVSYTGSASIEIFGGWLNYNYSSIADYIDDIRVYDNALSAGDVSTLFAGGRMQLFDGLEAIYRLDTDATEALGGLAATANGTTFVQGAVVGMDRSYAQLNGTSGEILLDQSLGDIWGSDASFSMWIRTEATEGMVYMVREAYSGSSKSYLASNLQAAGNVTVGWRSKQGADATQPVYAETVVNDGKWHMLTYVRSGSSLHFYVDGQLEGTLTNITGSFLSDVPVRIGSYSANSTNPSGWLNGDVDELNMWSRALSAAEVADFYEASALLSDGLVAKYALDTDASDSVGDNDGTVSGVTFDSGYATFERDNSPSITVPASLASEITGDYTISAWMRFETISGYYSVLTANQEGLALIHGKPGFLSEGDVLTYDNSSSALNIDTWYHIVMTKSDGNKALYVDGTLLANGSDTSTAWAFGNSAQIGRGSFLDGAAGYLDGDMNDLRVWSRALGASEVTALYDAGAEAAAADLTAGLVAKYALDTDASDSVGDNDGTASGVTFENGYAQFDGSGDVVNFGDVLDLEANSFSFSFWAKMPHSGDYRAITCKRTNSDYTGWAFYKEPDNKVGFQVAAAHGGPYITAKSDSSVPNDDWAHVVGVGNRLDNTLKLYIDGSLQTTQGDLSGVGSLSNGSNFLIGQEPGINDMNGSLDDLRIWSRALTSAEVTALYDAGAEEEAAAPADISTGLVLRHHAEDTNADIGDATATLVNVTSEEVDGKSVWSFPGQNSIVRLDEVSDQPDLTGDFSISIWFKGLAPTGAWRTAARCYISDHPILVSFDTNLLGVYDNDSNSFISSGYTMDEANFEDWNHITAVGSGNSTKFYINGSLVGEAPAKASGTLYSIGNAASSANPTSGSQRFADYIDDVRVYSRALSDADVSALHADGPDPVAPAPSNTIDVTIDMFDSWGDGWNGGSISIADSNGAVVYSSTGPANGVKAPAGLSESGSFEPGTYTYTMTPGSYPAEISATITDEFGTVLANLVGGSGTGTFDLAAPSPVITPTLTTSNGDITIAATLNAEATAAGAANWAYSFSALGAEGNPHGGTLVALDADVTVTPATHALHTVYVAAVDASGNVIVSNSDTIDNSPSISVTIVKNDSYNDSWDGTSLVITHDGTGNEMYNATLASGAAPLTVLVDLPYGTYSWAMVGGSYHGEHTVTITLTSDGSQLAHSVGHSPSSGSFTVGPPSAGISASASVSGPDITVTGTANATAVSEGAANWSASLTEYGEVGATIDGAKALTALGVDAVITVASGGSHTVYVAVVDAAGVILAKSSVNASVFISKLAVSDQMVIMTYLEHPNLSPVENGNPYITDNGGDPVYGPFYIGDLTIKTMVAEIEDPDELVTIVTFDDGSGGTLDVDALVKELIKKYDLNELDGDNAADGAFFQAIVDGTNGIEAASLLAWDGEETSTVLLSNPGGGFSADYDISFVPHFPNSGDMSISEVPSGVGAVTGPDGSSYVGTIAPGETEPGPEQGPMAVNGYFPTFTTQVGSDLASPVGSSHTHVLNGVVYYMPNGIPGGIGGGLQFHGDFPPDPIAVEGYYPLFEGEDIANEISTVGTSHSHTLGGSSADYIDNMIAELDFTAGMAGVTSVGSPSYSVQTINGQERNTIDVSGGQLLIDNMITDYVANRQSTDQMTISFWFKHNGNDDWIVSDMFGIGGGVQSRFRLTLDGRFSSLIRINPGLGAMNEWYPATGGIQNNGVGMQGDPLSHGQWHHVSMVYDETLANGSDTGDITLYFDGVKTIGGFQRGWGGLGADGLDELVNAEFFCIGGKAPTSQVFNGELSHFVVHGRALSEAEISELMGALPGAAAGTTYYMPDGLTMGVDQFHGDYDPNAPGQAPPVDGGGAHDWTFDGQLSNIVKMVKGYDVSGSRSFMFLKNADGESNVYITPALADFNAYNLMIAPAHGWSGAPVCGEHGPASCFAFGTSDGNLYKISLSDYGAPDSSSLIHAFGAGSVNSVNYSPTTQEWIVEHDSKVYTIPYAGGAPSLRMTLPAGSKVVDFAPADDAVALTVQLADFTFARYFALIGWATVHDYTGMAAIVEAIGATDFNYDYDIDLWVAAAADGTTVSTDDINNWLL